MSLTLPVSETALVRRNGDSITALCMALIAFAALLFAPQVLNDGDTFWHIRAGEWMLDHGRVLGTDPFSYTFTGKPWQTHEWLSEVFMALAFRALGWNGLMLATAACFSATAGLLSWHLGRFLSRESVIVATILALATTAGSLLARPHILALPILEAWTASLIIARSENRAPSFATVPLMTLWANLHASFAIGIALAAAFALDAVLEETTWTARKMQLRLWLSFLVASAFAALLNPHGIAGLVFPFVQSQARSLGFIGEWQATDLSILQPVELGAAAALYVVLTRGVKLSPVRVLILLGLLHMALLHARHQMLLAIIAPLVLGEPMGRQLGYGPAMESGLVRTTAVTVFALGIACLTLVRLTEPMQRIDGSTAPISALAEVPPELRAQPVLNDYAFGGYLIFEGVRPFIDSRAELYGDAFLENYAAILESDPAVLKDTLSRDGVRWTIFAATNPVIHTLDALPGWKRLYTDRVAIVHVRTTAIR